MHLFRRGPHRPQGVRLPRRDWIDVEGIIVRQTGNLDWAYIDRELRPLAELKEAPEILNELEKRRRELER